MRYYFESYFYSLLQSLPSQQKLSCVFKSHKAGIVSPETLDIGHINTYSQLQIVEGSLKEWVWLARCEYRIFFDQMLQLLFPPLIFVRLLFEGGVCLFV